MAIWCQVLTSSPCVSPDGSLVVVGDNNGTMYGVDATSGAPKWTRQASDLVSQKSPDPVSSGIWGCMGMHGDAWGCMEVHRSAYGYIGVHKDA